MSRTSAPAPLAAASPSGVRLLAVSGACTVVGGVVAAVGVPDHDGFLTFVLVVVVAALGAALLTARTSDARRGQDQHLTLRRP